MTRIGLAAASAGGCVVLLASVALAHVHMAGATFATAGENQVVTFGVGHGCEGADTIREIEIPER